MVTMEIYHNLWVETAVILPSPPMTATMSIITTNWVT